MLWKKAPAETNHASITRFHSPDGQWCTRTETVRQVGNQTFTTVSERGSGDYRRTASSTTTRTGDSSVTQTAVRSGDAWLNETAVTQRRGNVSVTNGSARASGGVWLNEVDDGQTRTVRTNGDFSALDAFRK